VRRSRFAPTALLVLVAATASPAAAGDARQVMAEAFALFEARSYEKAAGKFAEAAAKSGEERLDPAPAGYDRAVALLKAGKDSEAAAAFTEALRSTDPGLRQRSHYNQGLALANAAGAAENRGEREEALRLLDQALDAYESAMRIDPNDEDPKVNHELVSRKRSQLEQRIRERKGGGADRGRDREDRGEERPRPGPQEAEERKPGAPGGGPTGRGQEMTPDEARMILDAMKRQEQAQRSRIRPFSGRSASVEKNW
jgi:tetratricopeptide (TPR) repeat protein